MAFCLKILPFASKPRELAFAFLLTLIAPWLQIPEARAQSLTPYRWSLDNPATLHFYWQSTFNAGYSLQSSSNFVNWSQLAFLYCNCAGELDSTVTINSNGPPQFFVVRVYFGRTEMPTAFVTVPQPVVASPTRLRVAGMTQSLAEPVVIPELMPIGWKPGE